MQVRDGRGRLASRARYHQQWRQCAPDREIAMTPFTFRHQRAASALLLIALWPGAGAFASPVSGGGEQRVIKVDGDVPSIRMAYGDLDLNTPEGVASLYVRIRRAAAELCDSKRMVTGSRLSTAFDGCVRSAIAATIRRVGVAGLATLHAEQQALQGEPVPKPDCAQPTRVRIII
jgi:UrcA family protein